MTFINAPMPPKANGKPHTNKDYTLQGFNAAHYGISADDCPYLHTSTAEKYWLKGHADAKAR